MKKVIIFLAVVIVLFAGLAFMTNMQNKQKVGEDNQYDESNLKPSTIALLDDPNYQNIIVPSQLQEKLDKKENVTVYFFSPECPHCLDTTPIVAPLAKEMGIDLVQYNILESPQGWDEHNIEETPTIVQYKKGKETARITGYKEKEVFKQWFKEHSK